MADQVREAQQAICWLVEDGHGYRGVTFVDPATGEGAYDGFTTTPLIAATASHAADVEAMRDALRRISLAKPDRLDHSRDVAIIERAARIASAAIKGDKP